MRNSLFYKNLRTIIISSASLFHFHAFTKTIVIPASDLYLATRAVGMGGALVSVPDDDNAIFHNPAGIGYTNSKRSTKSNLKSASFPNASESTNIFTKKIMNNYLNDTTKDPTSKATSNILNAKPIEIFFTRASFFPNFVVGRFQFGILADYQAQAFTTTYTSNQVSAFSTATNPMTYDRTVSIFSRSQVGPVGGFSIPLSKNGGTTFGIGGRYLSRSTLLYDIEANSNAAIQESVDDAHHNINKTSGAAIDAGFILPIKGFLNFKFGIAALDLGDTTYYSSEQNSSYKEIEKMNIKSGFSINPRLSKNVSLLFSTEAERINDKRLIASDKLKIGSEIRFGSFVESFPSFTLKGGYAHRGFTAGVSLNAIFANLEFSTYTEIVTTQISQVIDRRYSLKLTVELSDV